MEKTQNFINRAIAIHGSKYDYSKVEYVNTSQKIVIICPKHGEFQMTPHHHLQGDGCVKCNKEARAEAGRLKFIEDAKNVHGERYDYSKVIYEASNRKVCIICREHGEFWQTRQAHIISKQNCPKCAAISGGRKRTGDNNCMKRESVKLKAQSTCLERYGTKTWAEASASRKIQRDIVLSGDMLDRMKATCQERYGVDNWTQSDVGHEKLSEIMSSDEMKEKIRTGYLSKYGVDHYMKTDTGRAIARESMLMPEHQQKVAEAMIAKYGVRWAAQVPGVARAGWRTKRADGTYNHSNPESTLYLLLCDVFGKNDVFWEYATDERYPFSCDFYIKSLDLFIELNAHWTHGGHWFDDTDEDDLQTVEAWRNKNSRYYDEAIITWTKRDVLKRQTAIKNNLNYLAFWCSNLYDAKEWLKQFIDKNE